MIKRIEDVIYLVLFAMVTWMVLWGATTYASIPKNGCNQDLYDAVYKKITQQAIEEYRVAMTTTEEHIASMRKSESVESLRALCKGQKSTYETGVTK